MPYLPVILALGLLGCATTEAQRAARAVCSGDDGSPEHCPGAPCTGCHGAEFALAGTIYAHPTDALGLEGAIVRFTDADGVEYAAVTNRVGNFLVEETGNARDVGDDGDGRLFVASAPRFPIVRITVQRSAGSTEPLVTMASEIQREGSCATCHALADTTTSATGPGRVYAIQLP